MIDVILIKKAKNKKKKLQFRTPIKLFEGYIIYPDDKIPSIK